MRHWEGAVIKLYTANRFRTSAAENFRHSPQTTGWGAWFGGEGGTVFFCFVDEVNIKQGYWQGCVTGGRSVFFSRFIGHHFPSLFCCCTIWYTIMCPQHPVATSVNVLICNKCFSSNNLIFHGNKIINIQHYFRTMFPTNPTKEWNLHVFHTDCHYTMVWLTE